MFVLGQLEHNGEYCTAGSKLLITNKWTTCTGMYFNAVAKPIHIF